MSEGDLLAIIACGEPILRRRARAVDPSNLRTAELQHLIVRMRATMAAAPGVGLAAPQIGEDLQIAVIEDGPQHWRALTEAELAARERDIVPFAVLVNPSYEPVGDRMVSFYEGCLSVPGLTGVVSRHHSVRVTALSELGRPIDRMFSGWAARIVQHEIDHLAGHLYLDRAESRSLSTTGNHARLWAGRSPQDAADALGFSLTRPASST